MLAVSAPLDSIEALIRDEKLDLIVANKNTPEQGVLSGRRDEIERAAAACKKAGMRCVALDVAAAFHSALVAEAATPFHAAIKNVELSTPTARVYANKTAQIYAKEHSEICTLLAEQIAHPVEFVSLIKQMYADGINTFIEVGPGARISGMVSKILPEAADINVIPLDSSNGKRNGMHDVARCLARLAVTGLPVQLQNWDEEYARIELSKPESKDKKPRMSIKLCGANYIKEKPAIPPSTRTLVDSSTIKTAPADVAAPHSAGGEPCTNTGPRPCSGVHADAAGADEHAAKDAGGYGPPA